jgi:asparagine synthase (glutamine-hydrolysing)
MVSDDGEWVIIFNGEIYNFKDLRRELEGEGVKFTGHSDTEVALCAIARCGPEVIRRFNGIFAIAVWNLPRRELFLARDRFGVKPLYYYRLPDGIVFGSEIKAILKSGRVQSAIDPAALHEFMYFGSALGPNTLFRHIQKLEPGHWLRCRSGEVQEECYWSAEQVQPLNDDFDTAVLRVRELLEGAVRRQLVSDVPVGVFLSGGVDSSCIAAFATHHYPGKLQTFAAGFDFDRGINELPKARRVAAQLGTEHHEIHVTSESLPDVLEKLVIHHDEPFSDAANIPLYLMCQQLGGKIKVVLQGDGGDEIFGGYRRYEMLGRFKFWSRVGKLVPRRWLVGESGRRLRRMLVAFAEDDDAIRMALLLTVETQDAPPIRILSRRWIEQLEESDPFTRYREMNHRFAHLDRVQRMLYTDVNIILPDIFLEKVDKATMAHGIESRVPLLDNELTDYVMGLPSKFKVRRGQKKWLLRQALRGIVADDILDGPKTGFEVPFGYWLREPLKEFSLQILLDAETKQWNLFNNDVLGKLLREHQSGRRNHGFLLWKALNLALWYKTYFADDVSL